MAEILYGNSIAQELQDKLKKEIEIANKVGIVSLGVVYVGNDEGSEAYRRGINKKAESIGIIVKEFGYEESISEDELISQIKKLGIDPKINGIIVQLPLPKKYHTQHILDAIPSNKDLDGLSSRSVASLYTKEKGFVPTTALAVMKMLDYYRIPLEGKRAIIIGRSSAVGRPVAQLLLNRNATVTIAHSRTQNLSSLTLDADILVVAVGKAKLVKESWVKDHTVVIDVGINLDEDNKMCGDVDFKTFSQRDVMITPVPKGVGSLTSILLLEKVWEAYRND